MELETQVQRLDEAVCVLLHTNALGIGMYPLVLPQLLVNSRIDWFFSLDEVTSSRVGKLLIETSYKVK